VTPAVRHLCAVNVRSMVEWISAVPFEAWPQQTPLGDGQLRPAMVNDYGWCPVPGLGRLKDACRRAQVLADVGAAIDAALVLGAEADFRSFMLSAVMPGHSIEPHADAQAAGWVTRVHVPLLTNPWAFFDVVDPVRRRYQMQVGDAYLVDVQQTHEVINAGQTPRVHFMFDVFAGAP